MTTEMLQVLLFIFAHTIKQGTTGLAENDQENLVAELRAAGFSKDQILEAFIWLDNSYSKEHLLDQREKHEEPKGMRFYHPFELQKLTIESRGLLLSFEESGLITPVMREELIERACMLGIPEVRPEHLHWLILSMLCRNDGYNSALLWLHDYQKKDASKIH